MLYFFLPLYPSYFQRSRIQIWLYEQSNTRIEGHIIGFDEYMNLVLDEAEEVHIKNKNRKALGEYFLSFCKVLKYYYF